MIDATILLLVYYYDYADRHHPVLKNIVAKYSGTYLPFDTYLYEPLTKTFSRVILYDYLKGAAEMGHKAMNQKIIATVRQEHPRYVLWTSYYYDVFPQTLDTIRQEGSTVVGWYFDDEWRFDRYSKYWIPHLDYSVTNSIGAVPKYRALNARVIQTIPNTGVAYYPDWENLKEKYAVSFVGSRVYANREQLFNNIEKSGIHIDAFGSGWPKGYIPFEEMIDIFQTSKINLNFSAGGPAEGNVLQLKGRVFQVCLAGGFLLTEYAPGLEQYFIIDKEITCFRTTEEMAAKIGYYLSHDEERRSIAHAGWSRAIREYSSAAMMARVFEEIEAANLQVPEIKPVKLRIPLKSRGMISGYYLDWILAFRNEKGNGRWKEVLWLMLRHNPFSIPPTWLGDSLVRLFPSPIQKIIKKGYRAIVFCLKTARGW